MSILIKPLLRAMFCAIFAAAGGCQALAAVLDKTSDPTEKATYVPEKDTMLVLVEDYQNPAMIEVVAEHMNRLIAEELVANKVAPIVNPDRLTNYRNSHTDDYRKMQIYAIGSELGAMQVLYANITDFTIDTVPGTEIRKGHAEVRVKVVDSRTKLPRWPKDGTGAGYQLIVDIPFGDDSNNESVSATDLRSVLSREVASRIAKLFHDATSQEPEPAPSYPESGVLR